MDIKFSNCSLQDAIKQLMEHPERSHDHVYLAKWLHELKLMRHAMHEMMVASAPARRASEEFFREFQGCSWHNGTCKENHE